MDLDEATGAGCYWLFLGLIVAVGCLVGGVAAAAAWAVLADPLPPGGSGNGRNSYAWPLIGGLIGAAVGLLAAVKVHRRSS